MTTITLRLQKDAKIIRRKNLRIGLRTSPGTTIKKRNEDKTIVALNEANTSSKENVWECCSNSQKFVVIYHY
jgi:hypothetical protein